MARRGKSKDPRAEIDAAARLSGLSTTQIEALQAKQKKAPGKRLWKIYSKAAVLLTGLATARVVDLTWRVATGGKPPKDPSHPEIEVREAIAWVAMSTAAMELGKILASRKAAEYWVKSTGHLPPGMKPAKPAKRTRLMGPRRR